MQMHFLLKVKVFKYKRSQHAYIFEPNLDLAVYSRSIKVPVEMFIRPFKNKSVMVKLVKPEPPSKITATYCYLIPKTVK